MFVYARPTNVLVNKDWYNRSGTKGRLWWDGCAMAYSL